VVYQQGKGEALAIVISLKHVDTPYATIIDDDNTYNPADVIKALKIIEDYDNVIVVKGNRKNKILLNHFDNCIITKIFNLLFGMRLKDVLFGFYTMRTSAIKGIDFEAKSFFHGSRYSGLLNIISKEDKRIYRTIGLGKSN